MASKAAHKRLMKEYAQIQQSPPPYIIAKPLEKDVLEWHYVITGPEGTPYHNGEYHGKLVFPSEYPFKPPSIIMITPSGRFKTNTKICLTMSDFHPELWNPSWSVASILMGLQSFMNDDAQSTTGSIECSYQERLQFARQSRRWNRENNPRFCDVFPDLAQQSKEFPESDNKNQSNCSQDRGQIQKAHDILDRGIGYGLCERFLQHANSTLDQVDLQIFMACRNEQKALQAIEALKFKYPEAISSHKVKLKFVKLDLTDLKSITFAASELSKKCEQIDILYCNAGVLLFDGIDWINGPKVLFTDPLRFFTDVSSTLKQSVGKSCHLNQLDLGMVFMANVFGHYILYQNIKSLLVQSQYPKVIWTTSLTADDKYLDIDDIQGTKSINPYESSKIITNYLASYLNKQEDQIKHFITDPGIVNTQIVSGTMSYLLSVLVITPLLYLASLFIETVTFSSILGAEASFKLSECQMPPIIQESLHENVKYQSINSKFHDKKIKVIPLNLDEQKQNKIGKYIENLYHQIESSKL